LGQPVGVGAGLDDVAAEGEPVDDIGMLPAGQDSAEAFYRIIDAAYERRSIAVTRNIHPSGFDTIMPKASFPKVAVKARRDVICRQDPTEGVGWQSSVSVRVDITGFDGWGPRGVCLTVARTWATMRVRRRPVAEPWNCCPSGRSVWRRGFALSVVDVTGHLQHRVAGGRGCLEEACR
jgi:hypothetical protein